MTTMVALVGGQPLPNLLPVRHCRPDTVLLLYTQSMQPVFTRLQATLGSTLSVYGLEIDPYDIVAAVGKLKARLAESDLNNHDLIFNVTGGTKAMAFAAYHVAQERQAPLLYLESERQQSSLYRYVWSGQQLQESSVERLSSPIRLKEFLDVHLGPGKWVERGPGRQGGSPFEIAVAAALRPQADEVMMGVAAMDGQIDLDVVVRFGNHFGVVEAKAGENGRKLDGIKQLSNAVRHLGTYTQQFYAITVEPSTGHTAIVAASGIRVIPCTSYVPDAEELPSGDAERLAEGFKKAFE